MTGGLEETPRGDNTYRIGLHYLPIAASRSMPIMANKQVTGNDNRCRLTLSNATKMGLIELREYSAHTYLRKLSASMFFSWLD